MRQETEPLSEHLPIEMGAKRYLTCDRIEPERCPERKQAEAGQTAASASGFSSYRTSHTVFE